ncbi:insulinase family protein [Aestuariibacter halophilus]|uniref:Insulinase family protein n=1 Tax=Fluctibacter halophilus TaxID=226011 RepID=A0ABS8G8Q7_9ALTE|nr:pitrilysin family protein [Aestuariibacter halophilus]MCC2616903.1 insulinase family protein [Aestuariibacter halophilus]
MKRIFKSVGLVALLSSLCGLANAAFTLPEHQKVVLDNGLTVMLLEQHEVPLINVAVVVKAGAVLDDKAGQSALTADSLLLGTQSLDKAAFEQQLDFVGASYSASANLEASQLASTFASKDVDTVLPLIAEAVLQPAFDQKAFADHKTRYVAGLVQKQESPRAMIRDYFNALVFQGHPYSNVQGGTPQSLEVLSLEDVRTFHQQWYTPDNSAVIVTGDFDSKAMLKAVKKAFAQWQGKHAQKPALPALPKADKSRVLLVNKGDARESTFMIGGPGIAINDPDYVPVLVVNTVLGGRFTSWLNDELRVNSGLTYGARSSFDRMGQGGSFAMSSFTQQATTKAAMDLMLKTYQRLWEQGIDDALLASAKAYVKGQFPPDYETAADLAGLLADMFVYGVNEDFINRFNQRVNALDSETVAAVIERHFPRENLQFVVIGQSSAIKDIVAEYGEVTLAEIREPLAL